MRIISQPNWGRARAYLRLGVEEGRWKALVRVVAVGRERWGFDGAHRTGAPRSSGTAPHLGPP